MSYTGNPETDAKISERLEWAVSYYKIPLEDIALQIGRLAPHPDKTGHYGHRFLFTRIIDGHEISFHKKLYREDGYNKASPRKQPAAVTDSEASVEKQEPITVTGSDISIASAPAVLPPEI